MIADTSNGSEGITEKRRQPRRVALRNLAILNLILLPLWVMFAFGSASLLSNSRRWSVYVMLYGLLAHMVLTPYSLFHGRIFGSTRCGSTVSIALVLEQLLPMAAVVAAYAYLAIAASFG